MRPEESRVPATTAPPVEVVVNPEPAAPKALAVIVEPFRPNDTPFELLKTTLPRLPEEVPAEKVTAPPPPPAAEAVRRVPDIPKDTVGLFENALEISDPTAARVTAWLEFQ